MATQAIIYPPIIDNTIGAFVRTEAMEINFYFQNNTEEINTSYVIANIQIGGEGAFTNGNQRICRCYRANPAIVSSKKQTLYKIILNATDFTESAVENATMFKKNTSYIVSLRAISSGANIEESLFDTTDSTIISNTGESVVKYAIQDYNFTMYGGLNADQVEASYITINEKYKLSPVGNNFTLSSDAYRIKGQLEFTDEKDDEALIKENDVLLWYQVKFYDVTNPSAPVALEVSSDREYIDRAWDLTSRSFVYTFNYDFKQIIDTNIEKLKMIILIATRKGYITSKSYEFEVNTGENELVKTNSLIIFKNDGELVVTEHPYKGTVILETAVYSYENISRNGVLVFQRTEADKPISWETFVREPFTIDPHLNFIMYEDPTVEAGRAWNYRIQFYYEDYQEGAWVITYASNNAENKEPVLLLTEDMFLVTKGSILKIRYNPEVTTFKRNVVDVVSPTLGGAYPFVRRNGAQIYRTFNINGLISYQQELEDTRDYSAIARGDSLNRTFSGEDEAGAYLLSILHTDNPKIVTINQQTLSLEGEDPALILRNYFEEINYNEFENSLFVNVNDQIDINTGLYAHLNTYDKQRVYEKLYREKVMNFLYSDQIMLFKSLQEGNMFIRLTNVSFTPNKQLDRNVYSFSAQAVEVLPPISNNYETYFSTVTSSSYTLQQETLYIYGYVNATTAKVSEDDVSLNENGSSYMIKSTDVKVKYKTTEGYVEDIDPSKTYLDAVGRIVPVELVTHNGVDYYIFKAGYYPETEISEVEAEAVEYAPQTLKVYNIAYEFD